MSVSVEGAERGRDGERERRRGERVWYKGNLNNEFDVTIIFFSLSLTTLTFTLSLSHSHSLSLSHTHIHSLSHTLTFTHTLSHTHVHSLSLPHTKVALPGSLNLIVLWIMQEDLDYTYLGHNRLVHS